MGTGLFYDATMLNVKHIPDGFRHMGLKSPLACQPELPLRREGDCFLAEVDSFDVSDPAFRRHFHIDEEKVYLEPGDCVPLILSYRRSMMEFSSELSPYDLEPGDRVFVLGGDGYAGSFACALPEYGKPISAKVIGAIPGSAQGSVRNTLDQVATPRSADERSSSGDRRPFVVAVVGSRMDVGKSTAIRGLTGGLRARGKRVAAGKVTGFGCLYETTGLQADFCLDFTDFGLTSTCGPDADRVTSTAHRVLDELTRGEPDFVILEFGDAPLGPYRVDEVLESLRDRIDLLVFVSFDLSGVSGGTDRLRQLGASVDFVTGPVANTAIGIQQIEQRFGLPAETNREGVPALLRLIEAHAAAAEAGSV